MGFVKKRCKLSYVSHYCECHSVQLRQGLQSMGQYSNPVCLKTSLRVRIVGERFD